MNLMAKKIEIVVASAVWLSFYPGCAAIAPVIQSVSEAGVTAKDRETLFQRDFKSFNEAMYWRDLTKTMRLATAEGQADIKKVFQSRGPDERIVENKIQGILFNEDTNAADVTVIYRYFKAPFYIVTDREEEQHWVYSFGGGWKVAALKVVEK